MTILRAHWRLVAEVAAVGLALLVGYLWGSGNAEAAGYTGAGSAAVAAEALRRAARQRREQADVDADLAEAEEDHDRAVAEAEAERKRRLSDDAQAITEAGGDWEDVADVWRARGGGT